MVLVKANDFLLTFFVITDPAPTILFSLIIIGATNEEFDPIKTLSLIFVLFFLTPSKLQVIVPAPILTFLPIDVSPIYERWFTLEFFSIVLFLISTKLPILVPDFSIVPGLSRA